MFKQMLATFGVMLGLNATAAAQTCPLPAVADTVEMNQLTGSDLMTVPVQINGKPKQFLLDLSTNPTEVSQAAVTELGLPESTRGNESIQLNPGAPPAGDSFKSMNQGQTISASVYDARNGGGGRDALRTRVRIDAFTLGSATGNTIQFLVAKDADMGKSKPYDGLLTNGFFKQYDVELDFGGKKITYLTATSCADPGQVVFWSHSAIAMIPMTISDGRAEVQVTIEGHSINAVIDTSSAHSVMRRDIAERTFGLKADTPEMMPDGDRKDGIGQQIYSHTFPQISLAGVTANNVPAAIQTNSMIHNMHREPVLGSRATFNTADPRIPDLTLGMDVLHQLHLYVAFDQKTLYVTAAK